MDFFEAQDQARKRTKWLFFWFFLGIVGVVVLVNLLAYFVFGGRFGAEDIPLVSIVTAGAILAGSGFKSMQLNGGGAVVANDLGGRLVLPGSTDFHEKRLLNVVEEMAIASGMPVPQVYVMDAEEGINAFAAGTEPSNAVIGVTRGCLLRLSRDELAGVVAHEFSHILNGDMRLNMRLIGLVFGLLIISIVGRTILESLRFQSYSRRSSKEGGGVILALVVLGFGLLVIGGIGTFLASSSRPLYLVSGSFWQMLLQSNSPETPEGSPELSRKSEDLWQDPGSRARGPRKRATFFSRVAESSVLDWPPIRRLMSGFEPSKKAGTASLSKRESSRTNKPARSGFPKRTRSSMVFSPASQLRRHSTNFLLANVGK